MLPPEPHVTSMLCHIVIAVESASWCRTAPADKLHTNNNLPVHPSTLQQAHDTQEADRLRKFLTCELAELDLLGPC